MMLGQVDVYPWSGSFQTSAMAEGALDGDAAMYEVGSRFETRFPFSRFDAAPLAVPAAALLGTGDLANASLARSPMHPLHEQTTYRIILQER